MPVMLDVSIRRENSGRLHSKLSCLRKHLICFFSPLRRQSVRFPVKMTSPPTAILYIAEDLEYMTQLKDTLHVKEVEIGMTEKKKNLLISMH